jgi:AcrR family transcriptional regulator
MTYAIGHRQAGRPREFEMDDVLDQAIEVFREQGFHATSIAAISQATGLTVGSIYKAFKDKETLFIAAIKRYSLSRSKQLKKRLSSAKTGYERVNEMVSFYAEASQDSEGKRGCLVVNAAADMSTFDDKTAAEIKAALDLVENRLRKFICQGQEDGSISTAVDSATVARLLLCLIQGMRVVGKKGLNNNEMVPITNEIMRLLT